MKKEEFDLIGKKISQYESPVDLSTEWKAMLEKQRKLRWKKFFQGGMLVVFLAFSASMTYWLMSDSKSDLAQTQTPFQKEESRQITLNTDVLKNNTNKNTITTAQKYKDQTGLVARSNSVEKTKSTLNITGVKKENLAVHQKLENSLINNIKKSKTLGTILKSDNNGHLYQQNIATESKEKEIKSNVNQEDKIGQTKLSVTPSNFNQQNRASKPKPPEIKSKKVPLQTDGFNLLQLPHLEFNLIPDDLSLAKRVKLEKTYPKPFIKPLRTKRKLQLFFNAGMAITKQHLSAKNIEVENYKEIRENSEVALETYTYDVGVNWFVNKKSYLSFGGNYTIHFDEINHSYEKPKLFFFEDVVLRRNIYDNGNTLEIRSDTSIIGSETMTTQQFNKYSSLNLGVSFGHYILQKKRLGIAINGGVFQNISFKVNGKIKSDGEENNPLENIEGYKKTYGLSLAGGIDFDYNVGHSIILTLRPTMSYSLFSSTANSNILDAKFSRYGVSLGLKYNW